MVKAAGPRRPRAQAIAIVLVALGSLGGSYLLFYTARDGGLWGTTNHGTFVAPAMTAADAGVRSTSTGAVFDARGVWWLWTVPGGECAQACEHALERLRAVHALLNRDAARVRRAMVLGPGDTVPPLAERYPRLEVVSGNLHLLERGIYIVDPLGNLVFHYPLEDAGEPVLDDLKRLLKVSQIG